MKIIIMILSVFFSIHSFNISIIWEKPLHGTLLDVFDRCIVTRNWPNSDSDIIDMNTGKSLYSEEDGIISSKMYNNIIYYYTYEGDVKKIDIETKDVSIMQNIPLGVYNKVSDLFIWKEFILFTTGSDLFVINKDVGRIEHEFKTKLHLALQDENYLYLYDTNTISCFDIGTLSFLWTLDSLEFKLGYNEINYINKHPIFVYNDYIIVISVDPCFMNKSFIICLDKTGKLIRTSEINRYIYYIDQVENSIYMLIKAKDEYFAKYDINNGSLINIIEDFSGNIPKYIFQDKYLVYVFNSNIIFVNVNNLSDFYVSNVYLKEDYYNDYYIYKNKLLLLKNKTLILYEIK